MCSASEVQATDNYRLIRGRHSLAAGGEWRHLAQDSLLSPARDGYFLFNSWFDFLRDNPQYLLLALDPRTGLPPASSDFWRYHGQRDAALFVHDTLKVTSRLVLNAGLRYEYFGAPGRRKGPTDVNYVLGPGSTLGERVRAGGLQTAELYRSDALNFSPRLGFALDVFGDARTVLRGGAGVFFDRPFSTFWLDSRLDATAVQLVMSGVPPDFHYTLPASKAVTAVPAAALQPQNVVAVDQALRTPYASSWFLGLQRQVTRALLVEVNYAGSHGSRLLTADTVNRLWSLPATAQDSSGRFNPAVADISWRSNEGYSSFAALQVAVRHYWAHNVQFHASYTLSRTRDAQSDPLLRNPLESESSRSLLNPSFYQVAASFARQFDAPSEYGRSDFDQAQSLTWALVVETPRLRGAFTPLGAWQVSALCGLRSGFPFSVYSTDLNVLPGSGLVLPNRAVFGGSQESQAFLSAPRAVPGGSLLLDASQFRAPAEGQMSPTPRNAFRAPGFWNVDASLARAFALPRLGDRLRLQLRADFFNFFNHANLGTPNFYLEAQDFGQAMVGRKGYRSAVPTVLPLDEQPRRIQFALKASF